MAKKKLAVVIDLETTSTDPSTGRILSIGAVAGYFSDPESERSTYYKAIGPDAVFNSPDGDSAETIQWWYQQDHNAFAEAFNGTEHIYHVLQEFNDWFASLGDPRDITVWGNGPCFDISFLQAKYDLTEIEVPWKFYNVRDVRTVADLAGAVGLHKHQFEFKGMQHHALHDAEHEYNYVSTMVRALVGGK